MTGCLDRVLRLVLAEPDRPVTDFDLPVPGPAADDLVDVLRALWCELLDRPQTGPDDNFFLLGGTSMLAAAAVARIERRVGVRLPLGDFVGARTPRAVAAAVRACQ